MDMSWDFANKANILVRHPGTDHGADKVEYPSFCFITTPTRQESRTFRFYAWNTPYIYKRLICQGSEQVGSVPASEIFNFTLLIMSDISPIQLSQVFALSGLQIFIIMFISPWFAVKRVKRDCSDNVMEVWRIEVF